MAQAKFVLKEPNGSQKTLVYLIFRFNKNRLKYSTGEKILPKYWNPAKQRAKELKEFLEFPEFNGRLNNIEAAINNIYRRQMNDNIVPTKESLWLALETFFNPERSNPSTTIERPSLFAFIDSYIEQVKTVRVKGTITSYQSTVKHLKAFGEAKKMKLDFDNISLDFYYAFVRYLTDKGMFNNTIGKYVKTLKSFMREAEAKNIQVNQDYKSSKFKVFVEESDNIYLNESELEQLYKHDFSQDKELEEVRDLFLIGAFTGLRFSDFTRIGKEHIQQLVNSLIIKIRTKKTGEIVVVPLHWIVSEILEKYNYQLPKGITNDKMNAVLKNVGKALKMETSFIKNRKKGNEMITFMFQKFEQLTTHTARRSFATNAFLKGVPSISIMKITGHKTEKSFLKYIKVSGEDNAQLLAQHSFFLKG